MFVGVSNLTGYCPLVDVMLSNHTNANNAGRYEVVVWGVVTEITFGTDGWMSVWKWSINGPSNRTLLESPLSLSLPLTGIQSGYKSWVPADFNFKGSRKDLPWLLASWVKPWWSSSRAAGGYLQWNFQFQISFWYWQQERTLRLASTSCLFKLHPLTLLKQHTNIHSVIFVSTEPTWVLWKWYYFWMLGGSTSCNIFQTWR